MKARPPFPYQGPDMSVKEYHKLFQMYLIATCCDDIATERKNRLFLFGLTGDNKEEVSRLPFIEARLRTDDFIEDIVLYLSEVERYKDVIFGKRDSKLGPMDVE